MKEAEDSSPVNHTSTLLSASPFLLLLSKFLITKQEAKDSSPYLHTLQRVFTTPSGSNNQDYLCTYPPGVEHLGMIKNGRNNDKERDQGQLKVGASPEKIEKEAKKATGTSHPEKFKAKAPDGHHKDYILLLFVGLARKSTLVCLFVYLFIYLFLSDSRIVSHSPLTCKWQSRF